MCTNPNTPATPAPGDPLAVLAARFPAWSLRRSTFGFSAEHTSADGRHIRYIAGHSIAELAGKLETAEVVEP